MIEYDLSVIPAATGVVEFEVKGKQADSGLQLMQRVWNLLLSGGGPYRDADSVDLLGFLDGKNQPPDGALDSILALACSAVLRTLDQDDKNVIKKLSGKSKAGVIEVKLELKDGTTITKAWKDNG